MLGRGERPHGREGLEELAGGKKRRERRKKRAEGKVGGVEED